MNITYFNRAPKTSSFSIEEVFKIVKNELKQHKDVTVHDFYSPSHRNILKNLFEARSFVSDVNHITGDVNYLALTLPARKTILTVHDLGHYENLKGVKKLLYKLLWLTIPFKKVRFITCISSRTKQKILEYCSVPSEKIKVIPNGVPQNFSFHEKPFNEEKPVILQVGSASNKNLEGLIEAVKNIPCRLEIIGEPVPEAQRKLEAYEVDYRASSNLSYEEVYERYKQCDIVFFASFHEGFGVPVIEGQSVGRPLITSNFEPMTEVAGEAACFVDPYDPADTQRGIQQIIQDKEYREMLVQKGLENIKRFHPSTVANQYKMLYNKIVEES